MFYFKVAKKFNQWTGRKIYKSEHWILVFIASSSKKCLGKRDFCADWPDYTTPIHKASM